jgi:hypothetical protein
MLLLDLLVCQQWDVHCQYYDSTAYPVGFPVTFTSLSLKKLACLPVFASRNQSVVLSSNGTRKATDGRRNT